MCLNMEKWKKMEIFYVLMMIIVVFVSTVMYITGFSVSVISGTGGVIGSILWIYYLWKTGALKSCTKDHCKNYVR